VKKDVELEGTKKNRIFMHATIINIKRNQETEL